MFEDEEFAAERLVMSTKGELDAEENALRPKTMADYVGQSKVKENLEVYISSAKMRGEPSSALYVSLKSFIHFVSKISPVSGS